MLSLLQQALMERIAATIGPEEWERLVSDVVERRADPYTVAARLAQRLGLTEPEQQPAHG